MNQVIKSNQPINQSIYKAIPHPSIRLTINQLIPEPHLELWLDSEESESESVTTSLDLRL